MLNFLDVAGYWDPSLAFVMGCGILVSFPAFYLADSREPWERAVKRNENNVVCIWYSNDILRICDLWQMISDM